MGHPIEMPEAGTDEHQERQRATNLAPARRPGSAVRQSSYLRYSESACRSGAVEPWKNSITYLPPDRERAAVSGTRGLTASGVGVEMRADKNICPTELRLRGPSRPRSFPALRSNRRRLVRLKFGIVVRKRSRCRACNCRSHRFPESHFYEGTSCGDGAVAFRRTDMRSGSTRKTKMSLRRPRTHHPKTSNAQRDQSLPAAHRSSRDASRWQGDRPATSGHGC